MGENRAEFMNRIRDRMSRSFQMREAEKGKRKDKTFQNVVHTRYDRAVWDEMREHPRISEHIVDLYAGNEEEERAPYDLAGELVQDIAYLLYKTAPRYERRKNIHKSAKLNRIIEQMVEDLPIFEDLHDKTAMDPVITMMATESLFDPLRDLIKELSKEPEEGEGDGQSPIEQANQQKKADDEEDAGGQEGAGGIPEDQDVEGDIEPDDLLDAEGRDFDDDMELEDETDFDYESIMERLEELGIDRELNKAANDIEERLGKLEKARKDVGLDDGMWVTMSPEQRLELAEQLMTPDMQALSEMVGKMRRFALGVKSTKVIDAPEEIYDVHLGNDLRHLLRSEYALLATPETSYEFYRKFFDRELLQFALRGSEDVGKGPIVVAIDKSGSMSGTPFHWAMGVAEALRRFSMEDDRDYYVMFFGSNNDRERFDFTKGWEQREAAEGRSPFEKVLNFLSCQANGGTQFDGVLNEAIERCRQNFDDDGQSKADIVFITDGYAHLDESWIDRFVEARKEIECRMFSIFVGGARDLGFYSRSNTDGPVQLLQKLSDAVIPVQELTGESVKDIFAAI